LRDEADGNIDLGLRRVAEVLALNVQTPASANNSALEDLARIYQARIAEPIIRDEYDGLDDHTLRYPTRAEIFVPQAYRALRYTKAVGPLEDEKAWTKVTTSEDIGAFLLSYLSSPHSITAPLVALGHPGSGKSLLTEIIAARLGGGEYTPIRVELRDINADSEIQTQLEEQIRRDSGRHAHWVDISEACTDAPPLIILDGYDELLQASGRVFSTYLQKVAAFQLRESRLGRPVRVLVTSRITLIDKAEIPAGSTVIRLEDFDVERQKKWIETWNNFNSLYFASRKLKPMSLPTHEKITVLAQQPLLLLMLALYDSESNKLAGQEAIDQTLLYDSLLRRFIDRERRKGEQGQQFGALEEDVRRAETDKDMLRLGVAAIGMYNRRSLHISKDDLQGDIIYFETSRNVTDTSGPALNQAELLLGSFFFVHESKSRLQGEEGGFSEGSSAFEFLHNTFGEFLTADFILSVVLEQTEVVRNLRMSPGLDGVLSERLREGKLPHQWYSSLMFTPLYTRPVILSMLAEWGRHRFALLGREVNEFAEDFDRLVYSQFGRLLQGVSYPPLVAGDGQHPFPVKGVIDNVAIFTLNLALIRTAVVGEFPFDGTRILSANSGHPWDRMTYVWRAALGLGGLEGLSRVVESKRLDGEVVMSLRLGGVPETSDPLELTFETASALGDDLLMGLAGWALQDVVPTSAPELTRLIGLKSVGDSGLGIEMSRRQMLRNNSMYGYAGSSVIRNLKVEGYFTASSIGIEAITPRYLRFPLESEANTGPGFFLALPAEFCPPVWSSSRIFDVADDRGHRSGERSFDEQEYRVLICERAMTAAACISSIRVYPDGPSNTDFPEGRYERRAFALHVAQAALNMAMSEPDAVPGEVSLELLALLPLHKLPAALIEQYMGGNADPWILATRSSLTIQRLMTVSFSTGKFGLLEKTLAEMSPDTGGARFVHSCGMSGSLSILQAGARNGLLEQKVDLLNGILDYILSACEVEDSLQSFQSILSILNAAPMWITSALSPARLCNHFSITSPESTLGRASLDDFRLLESRYDQETRTRQPNRPGRQRNKKVKGQDR
jgi:hypothetical protein